MAYDPRQLFYTPQELGSLSTNYYSWIGASPGLRWELDVLARELLPWRPGTVVALVARPGHGKTSLSAIKALETAYQIVREGKAEHECVLYVSLDQAVEELEALFFASEDFSATDFMRTRVPAEAVAARALLRPKLPIWVMGRSVTRPRKTPRMTVDVIYNGITAMGEEFGMRPRLIIIDYLQIVPVERARERVEQVSEAVVRGGELALATQSVIMFDAQASRAVDKSEDKIPTISDCQWSSELEQRASVVMAAQRPWLVYKDRSRPIRLHGQEYPITPNLFILRVEKQRFESAGQTFVLHLEPQYVRLSEIEAEQPTFEQQRAF